MPSTCSICQQEFRAWVDYHAHIALAHNVKPTLKEVADNTPRPIVKGVYAGPMDKKEKARIVAAGERRIGARHFFGVSQ